MEASPRTEIEKLSCALANAKGDNLGGFEGHDQPRS